MKRNVNNTALIILLAMSSSSSSADPTTPQVPEFLDPTETFQSPPPTEIALGELLAESDFVAVAYNLDSIETEHCVGVVLRVKRLCAVKDTWSAPGPLKPHVLHDTRGDDFLFAVRRHRRDIITHGEDFDHDAYKGPFLAMDVPFLYFGRERPITVEQAEQLQEGFPLSISNGAQLIQLNFEITPQTPVRAIQGLRGVYPLYSLERMIPIADGFGFPDGVDTEEMLRSYSYKYLIQTYGDPDPSPLVSAVNRLLEALSQEDQEATQALNQMTTDTDPVVAAAATHLLGLEKLPKFVYHSPVPLPAGDE